MGSWLAGLLEGYGLPVLRAGRRSDPSPQEMARQCDVVVISVPMADTVKIIREIGPLVSENGLLMDLTSIKKGPVAAMLEYSQAEVVGAHPLFGPDEEAIAGQKMVICPGRGERGLKWLTGILEKTGVKVVVMEPDEHDRLMGLIQGVNHFSTLALALCISRCGFELEDIGNGATNTFRRRLHRIRSVMEQPAELFGSLLMDNPAAGEFIEQYLESVEEWIRITREGDKEAFVELFGSLKEVFIPSHHDAVPK